MAELVRRKPSACGVQRCDNNENTRHDDITYQSIAKAFDLPLVLHKEAYEHMKRLSKPHPSQPNFDWTVESPALRAKLRMVELPTDHSRDLGQQVVFTHDDLWVPVSVVNGNIHILPGVPRLCKYLAAVQSNELQGGGDEGSGVATSRRLSS